MARRAVEIKVRLGVFVGGEEIDACFETEDRYVAILFNEPIMFRRGDRIYVRPLVVRGEYEDSP